MFLHGDCYDHLKVMPENIIDVVVTSPPYNFGVAYNEYEDKQTETSYLWNLCRVFKHARRVLKSDGSVFLNLSGRPTDPLFPFRVVDCLKDLGFVVQNTIHWIKSISIGEDTVGHFKPINSKRYLNSPHEYIFHLSKSGNNALQRTAIGVPYKDKTNIKRWNRENDLRCRGNVWFIPYETTQAKSIHPCSFPVQLPRWCIQLHGVKEGLVVLDPFMGVGTVGVACKELDVSFIGIELDQLYYDEAVRKENSG